AAGEDDREEAGERGIRGETAGEGGALAAGSGGGRDQRGEPVDAKGSAPGRGEGERGGAPGDEGKTRGHRATGAQGGEAGAEEEQLVGQGEREDRAGAVEVDPRGPDAGEPLPGGRGVIAAIGEDEGPEVALDVLLEPGDVAAEGGPAFRGEGGGELGA